MRYHIVRPSPAQGWTNPSGQIIDLSPTGTETSVSFAQFVPPGSTAYRLHANSVALPAGVTLDSAGRRFVGSSSGGVISDLSGVILEDISSFEQDWLARSTGPSVVWAHDFGDGNGLSAFNKFLVRAWDRPNDLSFDSTDGIRGAGSLRMDCAAGSSIRSKWLRPLGAFPAGSGTWTWTGGYGSIAPQPWSLPADIGIANGLDSGNPGNLQHTAPGSIDNSYWYTWRRWLHGHSAYWGTTRESNGDPITTPWAWATPAGLTTRDFYFQIRCKFDPSFFDVNALASVSRRTKHIYFDICGGSDQELINVVPGENVVDGQVKRRLWLYTNRSGVDLAAFKNSAFVQPDSAWAATCTASSAHNTCWEYPVGEWFTMLFHISLGRHNPGMSRSDPGGTYAAAPYKDTTIEVWAHRKGESGYTKLFGMNDLAWFYNCNTENNAGAFALNCIDINGYAGTSNGSSDLAWTRWYDQAILSYDFIACPNDGEG